MLLSRAAALAGAVGGVVPGSGTACWAGGQPRQATAAASLGVEQLGAVLQAQHLLQFPRLHLQ